MYTWLGLKRLRSLASRARQYFLAWINLGTLYKFINCNTLVELFWILMSEIIQASSVKSARHWLQSSYLWDNRPVLGSSFHLLVLFLKGVTVNGQLIGAPAPPNGHKKHRTYFNTITILSNKPERSYLEITPTRIILDDGERLILSCDRNAVVRSSSLEVSISANSNITVTIRDTISFVILIHRYKKPAPYQKDHLGFYISNSKGLSSDSHGLLGK